MKRTPSFVVFGVIALAIIGGYIYFENTIEPITYERTATTTEPVVIEKQYDDEWLKEADKLREQHLNYRKWQAEQAELQEEIDALRERYNELDGKILEHEKYNQSH